MKRIGYFLPIIIGLAAWFSISAWQQKTADEDTYAHVFKPLDGHWAGKFIVYTHTGGQKKGLAPTHNLNKTLFDNLPLKEEMTIDVEQVYTSRDPYYQTAVITDTYKEDNGKFKTVTSHAVNKVEDDKLWCIVDKPDEQVVHSGSLYGDHTIIWQRYIEKPQKIEYFRETVLEDEYTIVGYGYYGNDNPSLTPKTWFYGRYLRQK